MTDIKDCFEKGKKIIESDLKEMEKIAKKHRKSRRKFRTQQLAILNQKQLELEDMLSSSDELNDTEKKSEIFKSGLEISHKSHKNNKNSPKDNIDKENSDFQDDENIGGIRMGLGGVPLKENGEPLELTASGKWDHDYDDTNSLVFFWFYYKKTRKVQNF